MSSSLKDLQCIAVRIDEDHSETTAVVSLTHRVDRLQNYHIFQAVTNHAGRLVLLAGAPGSLAVAPEQYRKSAQRTMWAGFAALGRSRLNCRKHNWTAPVELTAVQPSPWLYRESTAPLENTQEQNRERRALPNTAKEEAT